MSFPTPGDTFQLDDWSSSGEWGNSFSWVVYLDEILQATSDAPNGWTVTLVSGSYGQADCVVDVTAPASAKGTHDTYRATGRFEHGYSAGYAQAFAFQYDELVNANQAWPDVTMLENTPLAAVLEPDGLHFYRIPGAIADRVECGAVVAGERPQLFSDATGTLYLIVDGRTSPLDDPTWQLHISRDRAQTFELRSTLPFGEERRAMLAGMRPDGLLVVFGASPTFEVNGGLLIYSGDGGATWSEPLATLDFQTLQPAGILSADLDGGIVLWGLGTAASSRALRTLDFGVTWENIGDSTIPSPPDAVASHNTRSAFLWGASGLLMQLSSAFGGDTMAWATYSYDPNEEWRHAEIAGLPVGYAGLVQLSNGYIRALNGRDWQYETRDGGATWAAL